jgi:hypothetical protein
MSRVSTLGGSVEDDKDVPQPAAKVEIYELVFTNSGERLLGTWRGEATTNAAGQFTLPDVDPGEYYLLVRPARGKTGFVTTYHPGVADAENAVPIVVPPGARVANLKLTLARASTYSIRVRMPRPSNASSTTTPYFTITARSRGRFKTALMTPAGSSLFVSLGNDVYSSPPLPPDTYTVDATWAPGTGGFNTALVLSPRYREPKARFDVEVVDRDVDAGVVTNWLVPAAITGRMFSAAGGNDLPRFTASPFSLTWMDPVADSIVVTMNPDATFRLAGVLPGRYAINPQQLPSDLYLVTARLAGREVLDTIFDVESDTKGPLEVTVTSGASTVEGIVRNAKKELIPFGRVVLVPAPRWRGNPNLFKATFTDQDARFAFKGVPPGEYTVLAWDWVRQFSYLNPEVLSEVEKLGQKITVGRSATSTLELVAIEGARSR